MNQQDPSHSAHKEQPAKREKSRLLVRVVVAVFVALATLLALALIVPWIHYRVNNIVLREAAVRGAVTKVGARIDGRIKSVEVAPGQLVSEGQILLRMEDTHLRAALERARGEMQSALQELDSEKLSIKQARRRLALEVSRADASRKKAAAELEAQKSALGKLEKQHARINALVGSGAVAVADLDRITGDRDKAKSMVMADAAVLEASESNYQKALSDVEAVEVRENRLGVLEAQVSVARARVAAAEADMDSAIVKAPEAGRVLECIVNVGGSAKVGEPMLSLWIGKAWVEAWADERDIRNIKMQSAADISLDSDPSQKLTGHVESIGFVTDKQMQPAAVPTTLHSFMRQNAMVPVRIALDDETPPLQLGLSVLVGIRKGADAAPGALGRNHNRPSGGMSGPVPVADSTISRR
jgi:multidrug efflux system membrane fusion protein